MTDIAQDMPWLNRAWQTVQAGLRENRLPHALIIAGERGVGKRTWAEAVAELLLCEQRVTSADGSRAACGHCRQCELFQGASHPDVQVYTPEKSRMVKVDQVRALTAFAVASPQVARRKVAIIDRADQLNINAANALLKTLEEPLADVTLLLLKESGRPVLPTISSRCQTLTIPVPEQEMARNWLAQRLEKVEEGGKVSEKMLDKALILAGNAPLLALEYASGDFIELRDSAFDAFRQFMKGKLALGEAVKAFKVLGLEASLWLFEGWAADLARLSVGGQPRDPEAGEMLGYLARCNPPWKAHELLDGIRESRTAAVYNASPELEVSQILIAWQRLMPVRRRSG